MHVKKIASPNGQARGSVQEPLCRDSSVSRDIHDGLFFSDIPTNASRQSVSILR